jgi:hypothetical protein
MGFDLQTARFVFDACRSGADFSRVVTLGRQELHISREVYSREARRFGVAVDETNAFSAAPYVEGFLETLGAISPSSLDAADYEGATHIADLNHPLPKGLAGKFSMVIDGGTIEHVFDFRQACINVAELLEVGGAFISVACGNNMLGHGFYQFSPELFFRVFSPENGFSVETMILTEVNADASWYEVADPAKVRGRVTLVNGSRTYLMMRARKTARVAMFAKTPQQSDYQETEWQDTERPAAEGFLRSRSALQRIVEAYFPAPLRRGVRKLKQAMSDPFAAEGLRLVRRF